MRVPRSYFCGYALGCFSYDFKFPDYSTHGFVIGLKSIKIHILYKFFNVIYCCKNIFQIQTIISHTAIASASTAD